jgi:hypothetical protein
MTQKHGYLIANKFKTDKSSELPDYFGKIEIGGSIYAVSAWMCTSKEDGKPYLSLSVKLFKRQSIQEKIENERDKDARIENGQIG